MAALALLAALVLPAAAGAATGAGGGSDFKLTATSVGSKYAPTFTGDGVLGVRVPPEGQGYAAGTVPALSELAGFYAQPKGEVQQRANIPTWSNLAFGEGGKTFTVPGPGTSDWRQRLDLRTGAIATSATWRGPGGHVSDLRYEVLTDRARPQRRAGAVAGDAALVGDGDGRGPLRRQARRAERRKQAGRADRRGRQRV